MSTTQQEQNVITNVIQIKRGFEVPKDNDLNPYELGYCLNDEMLYIGIPEIGEDGVQIIKPKPVIGKIETWDILLSNGEQIQKRMCINGTTK